MIPWAGQQAGSQETWAAFLVFVLTCSKHDFGVVASHPMLQGSSPCPPLCFETTGPNLVPSSPTSLPLIPTETQVLRIFVNQTLKSHVVGSHHTLKTFLSAPSFCSHSSFRWRSRRGEGMSKHETPGDSSSPESSDYISGKGTRRCSQVTDGEDTPAPGRAVVHAMEWKQAAGMLCHSTGSIQVPHKPPHAAVLTWPIELHSTFRACESRGLPTHFGFSVGLTLVGAFRACM